MNKKFFLLPLLLVVFAGCKRPDYHSVLLITVDGLRADVLGCYGGEAKTPALDRMASDGVRFDRLITAAPLSLPAHATILTGLNPPEHGLRINGYGSLPPTISSVTESFVAAGFTTGAFVSSPHLAAIHGLDRAFGVYHAPEPQAEEAYALYTPLAVLPGGTVEPAATAEPRAEYSDSRVAGLFGEWLRGVNPKRGWFAWVQFSGTALPRRDAAGRIISGSDAAGYLHSVAEVDSAIGAVLASLASTGWDEKTVVLVTASSGESLGERDEYGHGLLLHQVVRRVPGLLRLPGNRCAGARLPFSTGLVQLAPTMLDLANVKPEKSQAANWRYMRWLEATKPVPLPETTGEFYYPSRSDSLTPLLYGYQHGSDMAVYSESEYGYAMFRWQPLTALQVGNWVYIKNQVPELYDTNDDPEEQSNMAAVLPDSIERLDIRLGRLIQHMASRPPINVSASNAAWRVVEPLGMSGVSPSGRRGEVSRSRIGLTLAKKESNLQPVDAGLAMNAMRLYPLVAATNRAATTLDMVDDCIALSPGTARFYMWRARLNSVDTNAQALVISDLNQAVEIEPDNSEACALLGEAYFTAGNAVMSLLHLRHARKLDANNERVLELLPKALQAAAYDSAKQDDTGDTLRLVEELLTLQPTLENRMWRVRLLIARQRNTQARQELRNILYANPDYFPARDLLERLR